MLPGEIWISLLKKLKMYLKLPTIMRIFVYQIEIKQRVTMKLNPAHNGFTVL